MKREVNPRLSYKRNTVQFLSELSRAVGIDAKGLQCDERISKLSQEKLREILEEVRKLRNRRKKRMDDDLREEEEKEVLYVNS